MLNTHAARIAAAEKELTMRRLAAPRLRSMQAILNRSAIERLYDTLNALHVERMEAHLLIQNEAGVGAGNDGPEFVPDQPALPGAEDVRKTNTPTPAVADVPFSLSAPEDRSVRGAQLGLVL